MSNNWSPVFTGVAMNQVGPTFDIALGYFDPTTRVVNMVGYTVSPSGDYEEDTDVTDETHLIQISSPGSTDRFARYPQVSQGDWTKGERQRVFIDEAMYYESDGGVDTSTPGNLTLLPSAQTFYLNNQAQYNPTPLVTDGGQWFAGIWGGSYNFVSSTGGTNHTTQMLFNSRQVFDLLYMPIGIVVLTAEGLWYQSNFRILSENFDMPQFAQQSLAYLDGKIYYINNSFANDSGSVIRVQDPSVALNAPGTTYITATVAERYFSCICSTASGIFYSTTSNLPVQDFLYIWSGSTADQAVRVGEVRGHVEAAVEALGTVYILVNHFQNTPAPAWSLYALVGTNLQLIDDAREIGDPNFAPSCISTVGFDVNAGQLSDFRPSMCSDARYLYISWPGLATKRIDLVEGGISQYGINATNQQADVQARKSVITDPGVIDVSVYGSTTAISCYDGPPTTGTLTFSFMDFGSPGVGKIFRLVEFETSNPLTNSQAVTWSYRLNQADGFTAIPTLQIGQRNYIAVIPNVKGTEIQPQVVITADPTLGAPTVTSITVVADLGKIINTTVSCRRNQQSRGQNGGVNAAPLTGQQLQANIMNIREIGGGRGYAYIPDPTVVADPANDVAGCVSLIEIRLLDYKRTTPNGARAGLAAGEDGTVDAEADVLINLVESFDP